MAAATRLVDSARPSRQVAGLRLAIARVTAVEGTPDAVLAALEPAAQVAADSDVPELESACRSMLGELHEAAGGLDAALSALRAAMSADRRDRERAAQLRTGLTAVTTTWALRPSDGPAAGGARATDLATSLDGVVGPRDHGPDDRTSAADAVGVHGADGRGQAVDRRHGDSPSPDAVGSRAPRETPSDLARPSGPAGQGSGTGRRARRLVAEALEQRLDTSATLDGGPDEDRRAGRGPARAASGAHVTSGHVTNGHVTNGHVTNGHVTNGHVTNGHAADGSRVAATGPTRRSAEPAGGSVPGATPAPDPTWGPQPPPGAVHVAYRTAGGGGSLIGDALLHELAGGGRPRADRLRSSTDRSAAASRSRTDGDRPGTAGGTAAHDPLFGPLDADRSRGPDGRGASRAGANGAEPGADGSTGGTPDSRAPRWERRAGGSSPYDDTVVLGMRVNGQADPPTLPPRADGGGRAADGTSRAARPARGGAPTGGHGGAPSGGHGSGPDGPAPGTPPPASGGGRNGSTSDDTSARSGTADPRGPARPDAPDTPDGSGRARRGRSGRGPDRPPSTDTDGLGLADLLAGALAAYRDL